MGIEYVVGSGLQLPFPHASFDFATAFMCLMGVPRPERALAEAYRVLRPAGFVQFSILHPCFAPPVRRWIDDDNGERIGLMCAGYFDQTDGAVDRWLFGAAPEEAKEGLPPFEVPRFHRTLNWWLNTLIDTGFVMERFGEPTATDEAIRECPHMADTRFVAYYLHVRVGKSAR
jgi:SAM-dependent methyltransferase